MRLQRLIQAVSLGFFVVLLWLAAHPLIDWVPVDLFLRLDPVVGLAVMVGIREFIPALIPGLVVAAAGLLIGRAFCGHVCPMGTTLDVVQRFVVSPAKRPVKSVTAEATRSRRWWKYAFLLLIVASSIFGVSLVFLGSPISLITRFYGLCLYPVLTLSGDWGMRAVGPALGFVGLQDLAYIDLNRRVFAGGFFWFAVFICITCLALLDPRFWCRYLCPAGALIALFSGRPLVRRRVAEGCTRCGRCIRNCPTSAISEEPHKTVHSECIVCLRCVKVCPEHVVSFGIKRVAAVPSFAQVDMTRRRMVLAVGAGAMSAGLLRSGLEQPTPIGKEAALVDPDLIRPPGSVPEVSFMTRCIRCGECMKACPTNTLQPIWLKAGLEGLFTPVVMPRLAACAVTCNVCGQVCPTGAIRAVNLTEKNHAKIGSAYLIRQKCLVWKQDKKCLVCDEVCPFRAVSFRMVPGLKNAAPFVLENRCLGCGWCESRCPVSGGAAIRVSIGGEVRLTTGSYVEAAKQYGLEFKAKDSEQNRLGPETFSPSGMEPYAGEKGGLRPAPSEDLPPGFTAK
ncbi:MAG: 4Fe-4S binding protein [Pseudomonadota bacterium]